MYKGLNAYKEVAVQTASRSRLVVMLYEGAIRFLRESVTAIEAKDFDRKRHTIDRAVAIVQHLHDTLDMEKGGDVAVSLYRLYTYITGRIFEGSSKPDVAPLEEAIKLLGVLLAAWEEIANNEGDTKGSEPQTQFAATGGFEVHV